MLSLTVALCVIYLIGVNPANADYSFSLSLKIANASTTKTTSSDYALIIPSAFTITQSGWNEITDGITAKVSGDSVKFATGYKLTVTATTDSTLSAEGIYDTISYTLQAASTDASGLQHGSSQWTNSMIPTTAI